MSNSGQKEIGNSVQVASLPLEVREYFVDAIEAGKFLRLHWRTVQRQARENVIPAHPLGSGPRKTWRFLLSELDAWMRSRTNGACRQ